YDRLSPEQDTTAGSWAARRASIQSPSAASHGHRSSSVNGCPAAILARFAAGWKSSASAYVQPRAPAIIAPTVVFPLPDTPVTTTIGGPTWSGPMRFTVFEVRNASISNPVNA